MNMPKRILAKPEYILAKIDDWMLQKSLERPVKIVSILFLLATLILLFWMAFDSNAESSWGSFIAGVVGIVLLGWVLGRHLCKWGRKTALCSLMALSAALLLLWIFGCPIVGLLPLNVEPQISNKVSCIVCKIPNWMWDIIGNSQALITASAGAASILALLQVIWIRRRFEFANYGMEDLLRELSLILDSVPKGNGAGDCPELYYLCMVHDPGLPTLLGKSAWLGAFFRKLHDVMENPHCKKHFAILKSCCPNQIDGKGLAYTFDSQNELLKFTKGWAYEYWDLNDQSRSRVEEYLNNLKNSYSEKYDGHVFSRIINGRGNTSTEKDYDDDKVKRYIERSASVFYHLFYHGRQRVTNSDWDVAVYPLKLEHFKVSSGNNNHNNEDKKYASVNIFCSDTRGLIVFFEMISDTQYTLHGLPVLNTHFVSILREFFNAIVKKDEISPVHLGKKT